MTTAVRPAKLAGLPLTDREVQVLRGAANGLSNIAIGAQLFLSEDTVKSHLRRAFKKLGARDRTHAVALALQAGWLTLADLQPTNGATPHPQAPPAAVQRVRRLVRDWRRSQPPAPHLIAHWWDHKLTQLATAVQDQQEATP